MGIQEVYPNPTVKQVIFQVRFPNLFFIETKIPEIQMKIMERFPESALLIEQSFPIITPTKPDNQSAAALSRIWQFKNPQGFVFSITSDSFSIDSKMHKSYNTGSIDGACFREIIEYCLVGFSSVINLPYVSRVGLRYIDEAPLFENTSENYSSCFNSALNIQRFSIEDTEELSIRIVRRVDESYGFIYQELFHTKKNKNIVTLDFDAFTEGIAFSEILDKTDHLHQIVHDEFFTTIKEPILKFMSSRE